MKNIIAQNYQKELIYHSLGNVDNVAITSLSSILYPEEVENTNAQLFHLRKLLLEHKDEIPLYKPMLNYPVFLDEIIRFAKDCILYKIEDLPTNDENEKQLETIIKQH